MLALGSRSQAIRLAGWALLILVLPTLKWVQAPSWSMFLWAEDADLFLRQGIDLGAAAFVTPYAGYFHLYTRLVAGVATVLSPAFYPQVMAVGWWLAYLATCLLLIRWSTIAVVSVVLQPHGGEVFFSATNAQWWLGLYLFVYFTWLDQQPSVATWLHRLDCVVIVVASLSGPFAFLVWPVMVLRRWLVGGPHLWGWLHGWVFLAGALQLASFLSGDRMHRHEGAEFHFDQWAVAFAKLLVFCADLPVQWAFAAAFLLLCAWLVWRDRRTQGVLVAPHDAMIVACSIVCLLLACIWAHKFDPTQAVHQGTGSRYTWIPYGLLFLLGCRCAARAPLVAQTALMAFLLGLCYMGHRPVQRDDLQYLAFADLARITPVVVPVHPQVESWPSWSLTLAPRDASVHAIPDLVISPASAEPPIPTSGRVRETPKGWRFVSSGPDPQLLFGTPLNCQPGVSVGVEVRMWRASPGWIQLFWSKDDRFSGRRSLRRFYPAGAVVAQFAFRNPSQLAQLRLDPADTDVDALIQSVDVHCLAEKRP